MFHGKSWRLNTAQNSDKIVVVGFGRAHAVVQDHEVGVQVDYFEIVSERFRREERESGVERGPHGADGGDLGRFYHILLFTLLLLHFHRNLLLPFLIPMPSMLLHHILLNPWALYFLIFEPGAIRCIKSTQHLQLS